jgi:hypothetical protein
MVTDGDARCFLSKSANGDSAFAGWMIPLGNSTDLAYAGTPLCIQLRKNVYKA